MSNRKKRIFIIIACLLTVIIGSVSISVAWVSKNLKTDALGFSLSVYADGLDVFQNNEQNEYVAIATDQTFIISNLKNSLFLPGSAYEFEIGLVNKAGRKVNITAFGLEKAILWRGTELPTGSDIANYDEIPMTTTGGYFGKQVELTLEKYMIFSSATEEGSKYTLGTKTADVTVTADSAKSKLITVGDGTQEQPRIQLLGNTNIELEENQAIVFRFKIQFVNDSENNQNAFIGFGTTAGKCARSIYITFGEVFSEVSGETSD